jgi:hypothetical protein
MCRRIEPAMNCLGVQTLRFVRHTKNDRVGALRPRMSHNTWLCDDAHQKPSPQGFSREDAKTTKRLRVGWPSRLCVRNVPVVD